MEVILIPTPETFNKDLNNLVYVKYLSNLCGKFYMSVYIWQLQRMIVHFSFFQLRKCNLNTHLFVVV